MKFYVKTPKVLVVNPLHRAELLKLGEVELRNTIQRLGRVISQGKGADGSEIKPGGYSQSYIKAIQAGTVKGKAPENLKVNLTQTGELLRGMQTRATADTREVYFLGVRNANIARWLYEKGFRGWFALGQVDTKRMKASASALFKRLSRGSVR